MLDFLYKHSSFVRMIQGRLSESPLAYRLARGAFWSVLGGVVSRMLALVTTIFVARMLGKNAYGELGMVQSTMGMFGMLAGFGLGSTVTKYVAEYRYSDPVRAGHIAQFTLLVTLVCGSCITLMSILMSPWIASTFLNRSEIAPLLKTGSLLLFMSTIGGVLLAALSGLEAFKTIARISIWQGLTATLITIPFVYLFDTQGAIAALTISSAVSVILGAIAVRNQYVNCQIPLRYDPAVLREWPIIWKYSLPALLSGLMVAPVIWATNALLANQPGGYGELGLFNASNQIRMAVVYFLTLATSGMIPVLAETYGQQDQSDFKKAVFMNIRISWLVALPITVSIIMFGTSFVKIFGKQFYESGALVRILVIAVFFQIINSAIGNALAGSGKMWIGTIMNFGWAVAMIVFSSIYIPQNGALGLAYAYLISYVGHTVWVMIYVERKLAKSAIVSQWRLIALSLVLIFASMWVSSEVEHAMRYGVLLIIISCVPLVNVLLRKTMRKVA